MQVHHGQTIEKVIRRNGHSITDIARLTGVNRRSVYNWFSQQVLKPHIITNIGDVIGHDFNNDIPGLNEIVFSQLEQTQKDDWKDKYIDLLEKYNVLLRQTVEHSF